MKRRKKGNILVENVIFLILNLLFLSLLMVFLLRQGNGIIVLEQSYAKEIALIIDSVGLNETILLNMEDAFKQAEKNGIKDKEIVKINGNIVTVKLSEKSGYSYSFFNSKVVGFYPTDNGYFFTFKNKNEKGSN